MTILGTILLVLAVIIIPPLIMAEILLLLPRHLPYRSLPNHSSHKTTSSDGVSIQYWVSNHHSSTLLIIVPGHRNHSRFLYNKMNKLASHVDTLYLDLRNHGRSGYKPPMSIGVFEQLDLLAILIEVKQINNGKWDKVFVFGTSMGAATIALAAEEMHQAKYQKVDGLLLDSVFLSYRSVIRRNMMILVLPIPWLWILLPYLFKMRVRFEIPDLREVFRKFNHVTTIFRGDWDLYSPRSLLDQFTQLDNPLIQTVRVPRAVHSRLFHRNEFQFALHQVIG